MKLVEFEPSNLCVHERQADPVIAVQPHTLRAQCVQLLPGEHQMKSLLFTQEDLMEFSVKCYLSLKYCNSFIRELCPCFLQAKNRLKLSQSKYSDIRWGWRSLRRRYWCVLQIELSWPDWQTTCREPRTYYEGKAVPLTASVPRLSSDLQYTRVSNPYDLLPSMQHKKKKVGTALLHTLKVYGDQGLSNSKNHPKSVCVCALQIGESFLIASNWPNCQAFIFNYLQIRFNRFYCHEIIYNWFVKGVFMSFTQFWPTLGNEGK